ncbi:MAG: fibrinogen-like YCDxxxxGGGW domain-containing protein [Actinomycetaceae bacterium]|nr:fibrinogen-like YCDxxxxGGGW domain-containing protein [Actinomycetaceae bacterium]
MSRPRRAATLAAAFILCAVGEFAPLSSARADVPNVHDGRSPATAAASCWEIKQNDPRSADGTYWLLTPTMNAPEQFFCDQTSDGGGWVLIGRGREGWDTYARGEGDPAALRTRERGPQNLSTVQLSEEKVNGLLGGVSVKDQRDPIRVIRATDSQGSRWQTLNFTFPRMLGFEWSFRSHHPGSVTIEGRWQRSFEGLTQLMGLDNGWYGVDMSINATTKYLLGFAYGRNVRAGSTDPGDFLYRDSGAVLPYAEVYVRPQLTSDQGFTAIEDSGTPEKLVPATVSDQATPTTWGVVGNLNGRTAEGNAPVQAFAQIGSTIFVGGNFTGVQQGSQGSQTRRTALAAFNSTTGEFIPGFNATFNGQVKDLAAMPDGNLLVAGDFTQVNGARHVGTVLLDPNTGATIDSWDLQLTNRASAAGGMVSVRAIDRDGDQVYIGGAFTHMSGGGADNVYARNAGRVSAAGKPDRGWNPDFNGTLMDLDASKDSSRLYAAGHFTRTKTTEVVKAAAISTAPGADPALPFTFQPSYWDSRGIYQQAVVDTGSLVFFGGAQHSVFGHDPASMRRVSGSITVDNGGDFQALASDGTVLYGGCHCFDRAYENAYNFEDVSGFSRATRVQGLGAWDAATGALYSWAPYRLRSNNAGAWELFVAEDGALWVGGDFTGSINTKGRNQWNGGWARYGARDRVAPAVPAGQQATDAGNGQATLKWQGVEGAVRYQVLRDDRVVGEASETTITVPGDTSSRFFIRAVDAEGNIGPSTAVVRVGDKAPEAPQTPETPKTPQAPDNNPNNAALIADGATWQYYYGEQAPAANWMKPEFDAASWQKGAAPLGYGSDGLGTTFEPLQSRPVASYYRTSFELGNPKDGGDLVLSYVADDGAAVYVNGTEVSRTRLSDGALSHNTRANASVTTAAARGSRVEVTIPRDLLKEGANVIAVETHLNYKSSRNMTFQATLSQKP